MAGCEEDSITFEEESFRDVSPHLYDPYGPVSWPGSYVLTMPQPASPSEQSRLRIEHCLMTGYDERMRIVQHALWDTEWGAFLLLEKHIVGCWQTDNCALIQRC